MHQREGTCSIFLREDLIPYWNKIWQVLQQSVILQFAIDIPFIKNKSPNTVNSEPKYAEKINNITTYTFDLYEYPV